MKNLIIVALMLGFSAFSVADHRDDNRDRGLTYYKTNVQVPFGVDDPDRYCGRRVQWYQLCKGFWPFYSCTDYAVQDAYYDDNSGRCIVGIHPRVG